MEMNDRIKSTQATVSIITLKAIVCQCQHGGGSDCDQMVVFVPTEAESVLTVSPPESSIEDSKIKYGVFNIQSSKTNRFVLHDYKNRMLAFVLCAGFADLALLNFPIRVYIISHSHRRPWMIQSQCHGFKAGCVSVSSTKDFSNCLQSESER